MTVNLKKIWEFVVKQASALFERVKKEPVLVRSFLTVLVAGGFIELSADRINQIDTIVIALVILLGGVSTRRNVKPLTPAQKAQRKARRKNKNRR